MEFMFQQAFMVQRLVEIHTYEFRAGTPTDFLSSKTDSNNTFTIADVDVFKEV